MSMGHVRWFGFGLPALVLVGMAIGLGLHVALGRTWDELIVPISVYLGIQAAIYICMFWARNRGRTKGDYRPAIILVGLYGWSTGLLVIHYGAKWSLLPNSIGSELIPFSLFMLIVIIIAAVFSPLAKRTLDSAK